MIFGYLYTVLYEVVVSSRLLTFKKLRNKGMDTFVVMFWGSLAGIVIPIILTNIFETPVVSSSLKEILLILGHGSTIAFRPVTVLLQVAYLEAGVANIISIGTGAVFMSSFQYTFLKHIVPGRRNILEICGILLVVYGALQTVLVEIFRSRIKIKSKTRLIQDEGSPAHAPLLEPPSLSTENEKIY